jgi:hypothetical protein
MEASGEVAALSHADWFGLLLDRELTHRRDKRLAARLRYARLRQQASVEDVDYRAPRGLDRSLFHKLTNSEWIVGIRNWGIRLPTTGHQLPLMGPTGCTALPHLRPWCTLHQCQIQETGSTKDRGWDAKYFGLRNKLTRLEQQLAAM